jgi:hypothetical protein
LECDDPKLALVVGDRSVGAHLDAAIERGDLVRRQDGGLALAGPQTERDEVGRKGGFLGRAGRNDRFCGFLNGFLFEQAYGQAQVPFGCNSCFKVKIATRSLRALMAAKQIAEGTSYTTKSGQAVDNPANQDLYSTYLYLDGLEEARSVHSELRQAVDADGRLGPEVAITIKRGCTNYERKLGPSDSYAFDPRLEAIEADLAARFRDERPERQASKEAVAALRMLRLIRTAYRIGDETYMDFTDGKPLLPPLVSYAPDAAGDSDGSP